MPDNKGERRTGNLRVIVFALAIWAVDITCGIVSHFMFQSGAWTNGQPYQPSWWVAMIVVGTLAAGHLWRAPSAFLSGILGKRNDQ